MEVENIRENGDIRRGKGGNLLLITVPSMHDDIFEFSPIKFL